MNINKLKKQEMLDILNNTFINLNLSNESMTTDDLKGMLRLYKRGYIIKSIHDCTEEELQKVFDFQNSNYFRIVYGFVAIKTNEKPKELKEFCLKVKLKAEGNFYIKAKTLEDAKQMIREQSFLNPELINKFFILEYKKDITENIKI